MQTKVSLIIRCLNEESHIGRLLTGVEQQTRPPDEILIVDSGSTDATLAIASRFNVTILEIRPDEFSFGRALNLGLQSASGDFGVFASAHVYPIYDTWLEHLTRPLDTDPNVAASYGRQLASPDGKYSESRLMQQWFPEESIHRQEHPFHNNANAAIRRSIWADLPYDEDLTGLEDLDWGKRAATRGNYVSYVAEAPVIHVHDETFAQIQNRYRREAIAHRSIYSEQRMSALTATRLAAANVVGDLRSAASESRLLREAPGIVEFRVAQFLGTWKGFSQEGPVAKTLKHRFYYPADKTAKPAPGDVSIGTPLDYEDPDLRKSR